MAVAPAQLLLRPSITKSFVLAIYEVESMRPCFALFLLSACFLVPLPSASPAPSLPPGISVQDCVLSVSITSPAPWYAVHPVASGNNVFVVVSVRDVASGTIKADAVVSLSSDGSVIQPAMAYNSTASSYEYSFRQSVPGMHAISVSASAPSCLSDSQSQTYNYYEDTVRSMPDFDFLLLPLVACFAVLALRVPSRRQSFRRPAKR